MQRSDWLEGRSAEVDAGCHGVGLSLRRRRYGQDGRVHQEQRW